MIVGPEFITGSSRMKSGTGQKNDTEYDKYHRHDKTGQSKRKPDGKHATQQSKTNRPRSANAD